MTTQEFQKNEMLVFPPGGFNTFDEVCTVLLVLPALMSLTEVSLALDGWLPVLGCCRCGDGGVGTCGLVSCTWGLGFAVFLVVGGGASEPNEIELPPPGGRITLRTRYTMHNNANAIKWNLNSPRRWSLGLVQSLVVHSIRHGAGEISRRYNISLLKLAAPTACTITLPQMCKLMWSKYPEYSITQPKYWNSLTVHTHEVEATAFLDFSSEVPRSTSCLNLQYVYSGA